MKWCARSCLLLIFLARPAWSGEEVDPEEDEAHSVMHGDSLDYYREFGMHKEIFQGLDERILHPDPDSLHHYFQNLDNVTVQEVAIRLSGLGLSTDEFFLMTMSIIIFFMQAGFAFLEAGSVRSKNTTNILIKNLLDCLIGSLAYWLIGFPLAFGHSGNGFMGWTYWASSGLPEHEFGHWFFDFVHAATAATLVSGSLAERCNFWAYLAYSFIITAFIYPVASHWAWSSDGWLYVTAFTDNAGSGVVHMLGGICALVGAVLIGPRIGRFEEKTGRAFDIRGHSVPLAALGGFILLFGFLAFNAGFHGHISQPGDGAIVSRSIMNSLLGACGGGLGTLVLARLGLCFTTAGGAWSFLLTLNGTLAGLVGVCGGSDVFYPWAALLTGTISGFIFLCLHDLLLKLRVDDPLDAFPVHFGGGLWGLVAVALLGRDGIILSSASPESLQVLGWNMVGAVAIAAWSGSLCILLFGALKFAGLLRVSAEMEIHGLDILKHQEPAYPSSAWEELIDHCPVEGFKVVPRHERVSFSNSLPGNLLASDALNGSTTGGRLYAGPLRKQSLRSEKFRNSLEHSDSPSGSMDHLAMEKGRDAYVCVHL